MTSHLLGKQALIVGGRHELARDTATILQEAGATVTTLAPVTDPAEAQVNIPDADVALISPGWFEAVGFLQTTAGDWDAALAQNVEYATYAAQAVARRMVARGEGGRILFLSSVVALWPVQQMALLATSLAALHVIARMAAVDLAKHAITVNIIAVGWYDMAWQQPFLERADLAADVPVGRAARRDDLGNLIHFLSSPASNYLTGAIIPLDGGYLLTKSEGPNPYQMGENAS